MIRAVGFLVVCVATAHAAPPPSTAAVIQLAMWSNRTCALHADGNVSCWGDNRGQELALDHAPHDAPIGMPSFHDVVQLEGACAVYRDRSVKCLGLTAASSNQLEIQPLADVVELGGQCARTSNGQVSCFDRAKSWQPIAGIDDAIAADGSAMTGCVVRASGRVSCWEALGTKPVDIAGVTNALQVRVGWQSACARRRSGEVLCWGQNNVGQLGRGTIDARTLAAAPTGIRDAVDLIINENMPCVRRKTGAMACWGKLPWQHDPVSRPLEIQGLPAVTAIASGSATCAAAGGREVWCWGSDRVGELGNGIGSTLLVAHEVPNLHDAVELEPNEAECALRSTGEVACWSYSAALSPARKYQHISTYNGYLVGLDVDGALWVGDEAAPRPTPKAVQQSGPCVIANGGEVWCSVNIKTSRPNPVTKQIPNITDAVEIVGDTNQCIRHRSGAVSCFYTTWGDAVAVPGIPDAIAIATLLMSSCAVRADHTVWCWGDADSNLNGHDPGTKPKLDNTTVAPHRIAGITDAVAIAMSQSPITHNDAACVVKLDGTVACWGGNNNGRLALYDQNAFRTTPVAIAGVANATHVALGPRHGCALLRSGSISCWGTTENGESGTLATSNVPHPVQVVWP
jgi:alpha-tubulin suppressor-like RCC1 family protein